MSEKVSEIREVLDRWVLGVNTGNLEKLGGLYTEGAVLVPTFAARIFDTEEAIAEYFVHITDGREVEVHLRNETVLVQNTSGSLQVISGVYDWRIREAGEEKTFGARFSFVIDPGAARPILHHHSSLLPEGE